MRLGRYSCRTYTILNDAVAKHCDLCKTKSSGGGGFGVGKDEVVGNKRYLVFAVSTHKGEKALVVFKVLRCLKKEIKDQRLGR